MLQSKLLDNMTLSIIIHKNGIIQVVLLYKTTRNARSTFKSDNHHIL